MTVMNRSDEDRATFACKGDKRRRNTSDRDDNDPSGRREHGRRGAIE